jgi:RNA polymerase sigma-70 factor (ECF subfamily)
MTYEQGKEDTYENTDLQKAINTLEKKDRAVVVLRYFEDLKLEEIAEVLEENLSTVKSRLYRSMKKLRMELEE